MKGLSEERETAEVVNHSCRTHLSPLLTLCDLYHTHSNTHTHAQTHGVRVCVFGDGMW